MWQSKEAIYGDLLPCNIPLNLISLWTSSIFNIMKWTQHSGNCVPRPEKQGFLQTMKVECVRPGHPWIRGSEFMASTDPLVFHSWLWKELVVFFRLYLKSNYVFDYFVTCWSLSSITIWIKVWKESGTPLQPLNTATCPNYLRYSGSFNLYLIFAENQIKCHKIVCHKRKQVIFVYHVPSTL